MEQQDRGARAGDGGSTPPGHADAGSGAAGRSSRWRGVRAGGASGLLVGAVVGMLEALRLSIGSEVPALHVFAPAVCLDGAAGGLLGALAGLAVPRLAAGNPRPALRLGVGVITAGLALGLGPWARPAPVRLPGPARLVPQAVERSLLWVVVDGLAPADLAQMPALGALAAGAVVHDDVWAPSVDRREVLATLLTGRFAPGHGARGEAALAPGVPTVGDLLRRERVATGAFLHGDLDLARGFEVVERLGPEHAVGDRAPVGELLLAPLVDRLMGRSGRPVRAAVAPRVAAAAVAFMERHAGQPWAALVYLRDPLIEGGDRQEGLALADAAVADLVRAGTRVDPGLVWAVVGSVGQVGGVGVGGGGLQVPWVMGGTGVSAQVVDGVTRTVDVLPSLAEAVGAPAAETFDGRSLLRSLAEGRGPSTPSTVAWAVQPCDVLYGDEERLPAPVHLPDGRDAVVSDGYVVVLQGGSPAALHDRVADPSWASDLLGAGGLTCHEVPAATRAADLAARGARALEASAAGRARTLGADPVRAGRSLMPVAPDLR